MESPKSLTQQLQLNRHAQHLRRHVASLVGLLDSEGGPIPASEIQTRLQISPRTYQETCRSLLRNQEAGIELYVTQEGVVLKRDATDEQRWWHLAWSVGLFQVAGQHLALDEDLIRRAPQAVERLIDEGRLDDARRVQNLIRRAREARLVAQTTANMYSRIERILREHVRQELGQ